MAGRTTINTIKSNGSNSTINRSSSIGRPSSNAIVSIVNSRPSTRASSYSSYPTIGSTR
jgi:hypothetical protein